MGAVGRERGLGYSILGFVERIGQECYPHNKPLIPTPTLSPSLTRSQSLPFQANTFRHLAFRAGVGRCGVRDG